MFFPDATGMNKHAAASVMMMSFICSCRNKNEGCAQAADAEDSSPQQVL
jgi:hypothetical protein